MKTVLNLSICAAALIATLAHANQPARPETISAKADAQAAQPTNQQVLDAINALAQQVSALNFRVDAEVGIVSKLQQQVSAQGDEIDKTFDHVQGIQTTLNAQPQQWNNMLSGITQTKSELDTVQSILTDVQHREAVMCFFDAYLWIKATPNSGGSSQYGECGGSSWPQDQIKLLLSQEIPFRY